MDMANVVGVLNQMGEILEMFEVLEQHLSGEKLDELKLPLCHSETVIALKSLERHYASLKEEEIKLEKMHQVTRFWKRVAKVERQRRKAVQLQADGYECLLKGTRDEYEALRVEGDLYDEVSPEEMISLSFDQYDEVVLDAEIEED